MDAYGFTHVHPAYKFLGVTGGAGLVYLPPEPLQGVEHPENVLFALLLTSEELEVARQFNVYRVATMLGRATRYYPSPSWSDRDRPSVVSLKMLEQSLHAQLPNLQLAGLGPEVRMFSSPLGSEPLLPNGLPPDRIGNQGDQIELRIPIGCHAKMQELLGQLPETVPLGISTGPAPEGNVRLAWWPGHEGPRAILGPESDGSCTTGGFIAFVPASQGSEGGRICEDGFAIFLSESSWQKVRRALHEGTPIDIPAAGDFMGFSLDWLPKESVAPNASGPVEIKTMMFYQPEEVLRQRIVANDFIPYLRSIETVVSDYFSALPASTGQDLTLVFAVRPGRRARFWADFAPGGLEDALGVELVRRLEALRPPTVRQGPFSQAMHCCIWGGSGQEGQFQFMPRQWAAAVTEGEALVVPDGVLDRVWPD